MASLAAGVGDGRGGAGASRNAVCVFPDLSMRGSKLREAVTGGLTQVDAGVATNGEG